MPHKKPLSVSSKVSRAPTDCLLVRLRNQSSDWNHKRDVIGSYIVPLGQADIIGHGKSIDAVPFTMTRWQRWSMQVPVVLGTWQRKLDNRWTRKAVDIFHEVVHKSVAMSELHPNRPDDDKKHTPFFTYWVTLMQALMYIASIAVFDTASVGGDVYTQTAKIRLPNGKSKTETYYEKQNPWIGPSEASVIRLGGRHAPCMRPNMTFLSRQMTSSLARESNTACCILNNVDGGCFQSTREECGKYNDWYVWSPRQPRMFNNDPLDDGKVRTSGSVCGQDPQFVYCKNPESKFPNNWPDSIVRWPVCLEEGNSTDQITEAANQIFSNRHMACSLQAFPCCYGTTGRCMVTTEENCDFLRGVIHREVKLCAQVDCLLDVCGMSHGFLDLLAGIYNKLSGQNFKFEQPYQWYRLVTSIFVHWGLLSVIITIIFQLYVMYGMEVALGNWFVIVLYIGSGVAGNLAGILFVPERIHTGPSGAQCGVLACLMCLILHNLPVYQRPVRKLLPILGLLIFILSMGIFSMIDAWGNLYGFIFGLVYSAGALPYVTHLQIDGACKGRVKLGVWWGMRIVMWAGIAGFAAAFWILPQVDSEFPHQAWFSAFDCALNSNLCHYVDPAEGVIEKL